MSVKIDFNAAKILKVRGLGSSNEVRKYLASEVKRLSESYVPMQTGHLKNTATIAGDGSAITYKVPYARYQYYGKAMAGRAPKHCTGDGLTYHGAPMRGAHWGKRMLADKSKEIEASVETFIAKRGG